MKMKNEYAYNSSIYWELHGVTGAFSVSETARGALHNTSAMGRFAMQQYVTKKHFVALYD